MKRAETLSELRGDKARELEAKLILSSKVRSWTISTNVAVEKNLSADEDFEFGYALGTYRPLAPESHKVCRWCRERLNAGMEVYGGLGTLQKLGMRDTAQYIVPGLLCRIGPTSALKIASSFGMTAGNSRMLMRVGYSFEWEDFGTKAAKIFR
jgi:hypothetical protein